MGYIDDNRCPLSVEQRLVLANSIDELGVIATEEELHTWVDGTIQQIFPHGCMACGITNNIHADAWVPTHVLLHRYPVEHLQAIRQAHGGLRSDMQQRWRATRVPVLVDPEDSSPRWWGESWLALANNFGLYSAASHGFIDLPGKAASYFSFCNIPERLGDKHVYLLNRLVPTLHVALIRVLRVGQAASPSAISLSGRQREILFWAHRGKTDPEIARFIGCSVSNVKYHLKEIFTKLKATNRTQAVAKSLAFGIIE